MGPEEDLPTLLSRNDHLNILRYIRAHKLREPNLVVAHGKSLLGLHSDGSKTNPSQSLDDVTRLAAVEQLCVAALDVGDIRLAEACLESIQSDSSVSKESSRYRKLLGMCLEASGKYEEASKLYDALLTDNPSNGYASKRKYCILAAQSGKETEAMRALNEYLSMHPGDISAWNQMAEVCLSVSDFKGAAYCYEEVVLGCPLDSCIHMKLGEVYSTAGEFKLARKHLSQSVLLDGNNIRAWFGLIDASEGYLEEVERANAKSKKEVEEEGKEVAKELLLFGGEKLMGHYKGTKMGKLVEQLLKESSQSM
jgi:tetratricopeptide (TPR) repeat protein